MADHLPARGGAVTAAARAEADAAGDGYMPAALLPGVMDNPDLFETVTVTPLEVP